MQIRKITVSLAGLFLFSFSCASWAWTVDNAYDSQSVGERCGNFWDDAKDSFVTTENSSSGNKSCKMKIAQGGLGWGGGFLFPSKLTKGDEYWMRFRLFLPAGFDYGAYSAGNRLKFIRTMTETSSGVTNSHEWEIQREGSAQPYALTLANYKCGNSIGIPCWDNFGTTSVQPQRGVWETYEIYIKADNVSVDNGGQGRVRAWKNGRLLSDMTMIPTLNNASDIIKASHIFAYWNGGSPKTQHAYLDDLVATNVRPSGRDSNGNPYIGVGNFIAAVPPLPPSAIF